MLAAGCGGGGGGITPPNDSNGAFTIDSGLEQVVYTPPASRQTYSVYAYFQNIASPQTVSALFAFDPFLNKWTLDYSSSSTQFNSQAIGTYDMTVWVIFSDDTENPKKVGNTVRMEDLSVYGATGPPPPPW
jgi:hypothetical protein